MPTNTADAHAAGFRVARLLHGLLTPWRWRRYARAEFIRLYPWPPGLLERLEERRPGFTRKQSALVARGLRQFFIAHLMSGCRPVTMPSRAADDLWHEFILYTRDYERFCSEAFGGFLHHTPAAALGEDRRNNEGLRRVWWYACRYESIDPRRPTRLPLLFALDAKLGLADGFVYHHDCRPVRQANSRQTSDSGQAPVAIHCGSDFSSIAVDGSLAGFAIETGAGGTAYDPGTDDGGASASSDAGDGGSSGGSCGGGSCSS